MKYRYEKLSNEQTKKVLYNLRHCDLRVMDNENQIVVPMYYIFKNKNNDPTFYLTGKLDQNSINLLNKNQRVSLGFIEYDDKKVKTVIAMGDVKSILYKDDNQSNTKITVRATDFSGRGYIR